MTEILPIPLFRPASFLCPWCKNEVFWVPITDHSQEEFDCSHDFRDNWDRYCKCTVWIEDGRVMQDIKKLKNFKIWKAIGEELNKEW